MSDFTQGLLAGLALMFTVSALLLVPFSHYQGGEDRSHVVMKEAFERGHAVQCLGMEGYYWECKE